MATPPAPLRLLSWNLQGSQGVDVVAVAEVLAAERPDVVLLQEVQRRQLERLSGATGLEHHRWVFKNLALPRPSEGIGLLSRRRLLSSRSIVLRQSLTRTWKRRVALIADVEHPGADGGQGSVGVVDVHLSAHGDADHRTREVGRLIAELAGEPAAPVVAGDMNDLPGGAVAAAFAARGWSDAWTLDDDGSTNWTPGPRAARPPTQRLDYIFVPAGWRVDDVRVGAKAERFDWFGAISDHLPLAADLVAAPSEATADD